MIDNGVVGLEPALRGRLATEPFTLGLSNLVTIYDLKPGIEYEVVALIQDFHGGIFTEGQRLRFIKRHYLPHDDGHTLIFTKDREYPRGSTREVRMYLQGTDHQDAVEKTGHYLKEVVSGA